MLKSFNILCFSIASIAVSGCANLGPRSQEAPKTITWQRVSQEKLEEICNHGEHYKNGFYACSVWNRYSNSCDIYTLNSLKPKSNGEQYVLGHETMHCFIGKFHNQ